MIKPILMAVSLLALAVSRTAAEKVVFAEDFSRGSSNGWQNVAFFKTPTEYQIIHGETNSCLRGVAKKTCSAFSVKLDIAPPPHLKLRWHWKIEGVAPRGSERDLKRFDHAARVFIAFDTFIGPPRTINYMWASEEKAGTALEHPKSGRAQIIVLQSGNTHAKEWITEERDVTADWRRMFGDRPMPKIVGLGLMTDSDSTASPLTGYYTDIVLSSE